MEVRRHWNTTLKELKENYCYLDFYAKKNPFDNERKKLKSRELTNSRSSVREVFKNVLYTEGNIPRCKKE